MTSLSRCVAALTLLLAGLVSACGDGASETRAGFPTLRVAPDRLDARQDVDLEFTFDTGGTPCAPGGGVRFQLPVVRRETSLYWNRPQTENRDEPGHVSLVEPVQGCALRVGQDGTIAVTAGPDGLTGAVRVRYRGRASGLAGVTALHAQTRPDGSAAWAPLETPPALTIAPGPVEVLTVNAPADVVVGEPFEVAVVALDHFGNAASVPAGTVTLRRSDTGASVPFTRGAFDGVAVVAGVVFETQGFQRITAAAGSLRVETHPVYVHPSGTTPERRFFGDLQFHTGSGAGNEGFRGRINAGDHRGQNSTNAAAYEYARDVAQLDFAATTEHASAPLTDAVWTASKAASARFDDPGRFTTFLGYEWTSRDYGHRCVIHKDAAATIVHQHLFTTPEELYAELGSRELDALVIPHLMQPRPDHRMWEARSERYQRVGEIFSQKSHPSPREPDGRTIDGVRTLAAPADPQRFELGAENRWSYQFAWADGHRLGLIGSSDAHFPQPGLNDWTDGVAHPCGLAVVLAPANTRDDLWAALGSRRCYATSGVRIYLDVTVGGAPMGSEITATGPVSIRVRAAGTRPLDRIEIVRGAGKDYGVVHTARPDGDAVEFTWEDASPPDTDCLYYVRVIEQPRAWAGSEMAWSSPVWVGRKP